MVHTASLMTPRTSRSHCVSVATLISNMLIFRELVKNIQPLSYHGVFFLSVASGVLSVVMGMRYKKSGKLMPGIMSGLRSESNLLNMQFSKSKEC